MVLVVPVPFLGADEDRGGVVGSRRKGVATGRMSSTQARDLTLSGTHHVTHATSPPKRRSQRINPPPIVSAPLPSPSVPSSGPNAVTVTPSPKTMKRNTRTQTRTYLFCAIRPEVKYHSYTFSTCNFAKNASVVKLQPKKAVAASSPAERKLMEELEQMKARMERDGRHEEGEFVGLEQ